MDRPFPAYKGDEAYIFVSYAHEDTELVFPEIKWLKDQGYNIWYDEGISPGSTWREELALAIKDCDLFLLFVTPSSATSDNCLKEVNFALDENRSMLAIHAVPTELPYGLRLSLSDRQAIFKHELREAEYRDKILSGVRDHVPLGRSAIPITPVPVASSTKPILIGTGLIALAILAVGVMLYTQGIGTSSQPDQQTLAAQKPAKVRSRWIAVLPFATLSGSAEMDLLAQGITTQMIQALAPIRSFSIVPYRTVENFKDRTMGLDETAQALNVRYLLDGRIQHAGDKIRIGIELIDGILGKSLWQESKTFTDTDMLTIQDQVTLLTSRILSSRMVSIETQRLATMPKEAMDANDLYFSTANFWLDPNQASLETSIDDLKRVLELDPNHAGSLAELAHRLSINIWMGGQKDKDKARDEACRLASRAVMLGGGNPQSVLIAAYPIADLCGDHPRAVQLGERAVNENPENAVAWANYAWSLAANGEIQEALAALDKAEQLDPKALWVRYLLDSTRALTHMHDGDWVQGVQFAQRAVNDNPGLFWLQIYLSNGLGLMGDEDGAREQWQLIKDRFPELTVERTLWYFKNSRTEEKAQRWVEGLVSAQVES